jgi:hypothetical protein
MKNGDRLQKRALYEIQVQGRLADRWLAWFPGMVAAVQIAQDGSATTTLTGTVTDQAALRGILNKLWDWNLSLVAVNQLEPEPAHREEREADRS